MLCAQPPAHAEGFILVSRAEAPDQVKTLAQLYARCAATASADSTASSSVASAGRASGPCPDGLPHAFPLNPTGLPTATATAPSRLPSVALGTMNLTGDSLEAMLRLEGGFAAVDTAVGYKNETAIGRAIDEGAFLICKVPHGAYQSGAEVRKAIDDSLRRLRRPRCELLLLHWPKNAIEAGTLLEVWRTMELAVADGVVGALGVCNFTVAALEHLHSLSPRIPPCVNQVERHPLLPNWELLDYCASRRIVLQAHTPLGQGSRRLLEHAGVRRASEASGLTPAQVLIQWNLRHGVAVVPKCSSAHHARQLLEAAELEPPAGGKGGHGRRLTPQHMEWLDAITPPGEPGHRWITGGAPGVPLERGFMRGGANAHLYGW